MRNVAKLSWLVAVLTPLLMIGCSTGAAAAAEDIPQERVSTEGLDLSSYSDQDILRHRIRIAIQHVCERPDIRDLVATRFYDACRAEAWARASDQVRSAIAMAENKRRYASAVRAIKQAGPLP